MSGVVEYYVQMLHSRDPRERENAYFGLLDLDDTLVPKLIETYREQTEIKIRETLIEVIWQHRLPTTLEFLAEVLLDPSPDVWKAALDGIVAIDGPMAITALQVTRSQLMSSKDEESRTRLEWIDEAVRQLISSDEEP